MIIKILKFIIKICRKHAILTKVFEHTFLINIIKFPIKLWLIFIYRLPANPDYLSELIDQYGYLSKEDEYRNELELLLNPKQRAELSPVYLEPFIESLDKKNGTLHLLDIGCGPMSRLASGLEQGKFNLTAVDPLADLYNELMKKYKYSFPVRPIRGFGESLSLMFKKETFDMIYCRNALDHVVSPRKCLENIYHVLKFGGYICLEFETREGTCMNWNGLHKHDLIFQNNQLLHYENKNVVGENLINNLRLQCIYQDKDEYNTGDWCIIIFKKYS